MCLPFLSLSRTNTGLTDVKVLASGHDCISLSSGLKFELVVLQEILVSFPRPTPPICERPRHFGGYA
jgi:hypothetical protein